MTPADIREARLAAGLTLKQAAALVLVDIRTWQRWEAGERKMSPAHWELFRTWQRWAAGEQEMLPAHWELFQIETEDRK